jgi:hypothetical protein
MSALHVTNGESAAGTLRETKLGGEVLSWADVLHEGPLPGGSHEDFRAVRARFLGESGWVEADVLRAFQRRDELFQRALDERWPVVLWFEHDLHDQLQLVQILDRIVDPAPIESIFVGSFEGRPHFRGLGELDPAELESLWPRRLKLTEAQVCLGRRAWSALVAGDAGIEELLAGDTSVLPFLAAALRRLLEERPSPATGLSRTERQLLEELTRGPGTPAGLFHAVQDREEAPFQGDAWVWRKLDRLGSAEPLLAAAAHGTVTITEAGRDVLAGIARFRRSDPV